MASTGRVIKMFVKARDCAGPAKLGDCPFCHKVMLVAELRNASFETVLVDLKDKPAAFIEMAGGKGSTPAMRVEGGDPLVLSDSSDIVDWLLSNIDGPVVAPTTPELDAIAADLFGCFVRFMKNADPAKDAELRSGLAGELRSLEGALAATRDEGPFLGGHSAPTVADCALVPKLYHVLHAAPHFKGFEAGDLPSVRGYMEAWSALRAWNAALYPPEAIFDGWGPKVGRLAD